MYGKIEKALSQFLRTFDRPFTTTEINLLLKPYGEKATVEEIDEFLRADDRVFALEGHYYMTHAGVFNGMFFSFVPTAKELEQKLFIPGDRCIPFADSEILSSQLKFIYNDRILPKKIMTTDCNTAREFFTFFGDEYASQYIAADPINNKTEIANNNFELPSKINLTGISLEKVISDFNFHKGDRILCRMVDWDQGIIEIFPILNHRKTILELNEEIGKIKLWNENLENELLGSFDKMGPCSSMEQQLSFAFLEHRKELCTPACGSIHEFLNTTKKISMELFGVETRLWKKGEDVPAVGKWNREMLGSGLEACLPALQPPACLLDCIIKDRLFNKKEIEPEEILKDFLPEEMEISKEEEEFITLQIIKRSDILREHYNWLADFPVASLRHKALGLFAKVQNLVFDIDGAGEKIERFPQQELVILSQLFAHAARILDMLSNENECKDDDRDALKLSLEGMEMNFEDICPELRNALDRCYAEQFKVG